MFFFITHCCYEKERNISPTFYSCTRSTLIRKIISYQKQCRLYLWCMTCTDMFLNIPHTAICLKIERCLFWRQLWQLSYFFFVSGTQSRKTCVVYLDIVVQGPFATTPKRLLEGARCSRLKMKIVQFQWWCSVSTQ